MIYPSAVDVLSAIQQTHETVIRPALVAGNERSAAATISHLLRHVAIRIEVEGQILADDIAAARALLVRVQAYLTVLGDEPAIRCHTMVATSLDRTFRAADAYPTLTSMADEAGALRQAITRSLDHLQSIRTVRLSDPAYQTIRAEIRAYIVGQIEREGELIEPAFADRGPRR